MNIPAPVRVFAHFFIDTSMDASMTDDEIIEFALSMPEVKNQYGDLAESLDVLLAGDIPDSDLDRMWQLTDAGVVQIGGGATRKLLERVRMQLRKRKAWSN